MTAATSVISMLSSARQTVEEINQICTTKNLPLAFDLDDVMKRNLDYRFEGFGLILGLPPKVSFWVHYKPGSPDHVVLGRFATSIAIGRLFRTLRNRA